MCRWDAAQSETQGISKLRCDWNRALLEHAIAPTYAQMLLAATKVWLVPLLPTAYLSFNCLTRRIPSSHSQTNDLAQACNWTSPAAYYRLWLHPQQQEPWTILTAALYREVSSKCADVLACARHQVSCHVDAQLWYLSGDFGTHASRAGFC